MEKAVPLVSQPLRLAWRLALAEWRRAAEQKEDHFNFAAAGQKGKRLLEKAILLENLLLLALMRRQR